MVLSRPQRTDKPRIPRYVSNIVAHLMIVVVFVSGHPADVRLDPEPFKQRIGGLLDSRVIRVIHAEKHQAENARVQRKIRLRLATRYIEQSRESACIFAP